MKSKLFRDTQGLDTAFDVCTPDKISVCLRMDRCAYRYALAQSERLGLSSGEYVEKLIEREMGAERSRMM